MSITPEIIGWIITGVIGLFILTGYLVGLIRGWNKSFYRFIWILAIGVVLVIITPYISRGLFDLNLSFLNLQIDGQPLTTISNAISTSLQNNPQVATMIEQNPNLLPMLLKMASLILNSILFVILFWILKVITLPFFWIFSRVKKSKKKKQEESQKVANNLAGIKIQNVEPVASSFALPEKPIKKRHALGSLMGLITGCFIAMFTLLPLIGVVNLVNDLNKIQIDNGSGQSTTLVQTYLPEDVLVYLDAYNNSVGSNILKYTGMNFVANSTFKILTSASINGYAFSLTNEVQTYAGLYSKIQKYINMDFASITQEQLDSLVVDAEYVANALFSSGILSVVGSDLLPYLLTSVSENANLDLTQITEVDEALKQAIKDISSVEITKYKEDLLNAVQIIKLVNDEKILYKIIHNEISSPLEIFDLVDEQLFDNLMIRVLNFNTLKTVLPLAFETALDYVSNEFNFEVDYSKVVYSDTVISNFSKIFSSLYGIALTIDFEKIETDPINAFTKQTIEKVGVFFDNIVKFDYIKGKTYENATAKLKEYIAQQLKSLNYYSIFEDYSVEIINSIFENTNWTQTFDKLADIYEIGMGVYNDKKQSQLSNYDFIIANGDKIGKIVDMIDESNIIGSVKSAVNVGIDCAKFELLANAMSLGFTETEINNVVNYLKASVNEVVSWETEIKVLIPLAQEIYPLFTVVDINNELANTNVLPNIGRKLDTYFDNGKLLSPTLFGSMMSMLKAYIINSLPASIDQTQMGKIIDNLSANLNTVTSWETEFTVAKDIVPLIIDLLAETDLLNSIKTKTYLNSLGTKFDNAKANGSHILTDSLFKKIIDLGLNYFETEMGTSLPTEFGSAFNDIINNVNSMSNVVWATELGAIKEFLNFDFTTLNFQTGDGLVEFGKILDKIKSSQLFNNVTLQKIISNAFEGLMTNMSEGVLKNALGIIVNTIDTENILSWETEFAGLKTLLGIDFAGFSLQNTNGIITIGEKLDSVKSTILLSVTNINSILINVFTDLKNSYITASTDLNIKKMFEELILAINSLGNDKTMTGYATEYKDECTALKTLLDSLDGLSAVSDVSNFDANTIGTMFDNIKAKRLVGNSGIHVLNMFIDKFDSTVSGNLSQLAPILKSNINLILQNPTEYTNPYVIMFVNLKNLALNADKFKNSVDLTTADISSYGTILDAIVSYPLVSNNGASILAIEILTKINENIVPTDAMQQLALNKTEAELTQIKTNITSYVINLQATTPSLSGFTNFAGMFTALESQLGLS